MKIREGGAIDDGGWFEECIGRRLVMGDILFFLF